LLHLSHQFLFLHGCLGIGDLVNVAHDALFVNQKGATALESDQHFVEAIAPVDGPVRIRIDQHGKRQLEPCRQALGAFAAATPKNEHLGVPCTKLFIVAKNLDNYCIAQTPHLHLRPLNALHADTN